MSDDGQCLLLLRTSTSTIINAIIRTRRLDYQHQHPSNGRLLNLGTGLPSLGATGLGECLWSGQSNGGARKPNYSYA